MVNNDKLLNHILFCYFLLYRLIQEQKWLHFAPWSKSMVVPCRSHARCSHSNLPHRASTRSHGNTTLPRLYKQNLLNLQVSLYLNQVKNKSTKFMYEIWIAYLLLTTLCTWHNHWENSSWDPATTGFALHSTSESGISQLYQWEFWIICYESHF